MGKDAAGIFNDLIALAGKFVEQQKGGWDQAAWEGFLSEAQSKGVELRDEMQASIGGVLESMKKVHNTSMETKGMENALSDISNLTMKFFSDTKGVWDHSQWEKYLDDVRKKGIVLTDETQSYVGGVLEASKEVYNLMPYAVKGK